MLHKFTVDLPKKHGRGGQSALRFARLRMEKRHNYVRKVAETAVQLFVTNDKANVSGMTLKLLKRYGKVGRRFFCGSHHQLSINHHFVLLINESFSCS